MSRKILLTSMLLTFCVCCFRWLTASTEAQTESIQDRVQRERRDPDKAPRAGKSLWTFNFEETDKGVIIRAAVTKQNEMIIRCDDVELQTAKGTLQARGSVVIRANGLHAKCAQLTIPLIADTISLEGGAEVNVVRPQTYYEKRDESETLPTVLELKGTQLTLRWPAAQQLAEPPVIPPPVPLSNPTIQRELKKD